MSSDIVTNPRRVSGRPQERGERRREALLLALEEQLQHLPLDSIGVTQITEAAGLGRSAFYFYFASKQVAVTELLQERFDDVTDGINGLLGGEGDPLDRMTSALAMVFHEWRTHRWLYLAILDACATDFEARVTWETWLGRNEEFLARYIDRERQQGLAPPGVPSGLLSHTLIAMNERVLERHLRADEDDAKALELHSVVTHVWATSIFGSTA